MGKLALAITAALALVVPASATAGTCSTIPDGLDPACVTHAHGHLSMRAGRRAARKDLADENLPLSYVVGRCRRTGKSGIRCALTFGPATYVPLGCVAGSLCPQAQTIPTQVGVLFIRRVARHRALVWWGPGKPEGICFIARS